MSYATVTTAHSADQNNVLTSNSYVEVDSTYKYNCYDVKKHEQVAKVVYAISNTFREDTTKRLITLTGRDKGIYKIETDNIAMYEGHEFLVHEGNNIAKVSIKTEKRYVDVNGKIRTERRAAEDELLITLFGADTDENRNISDEQLYEKIIEMGIGRIKKAIMPQPHRESPDVFTGNKYFVLKGIRKEDIAKIPSCFEFQSQEFGVQRIWLNYRGKKRRCNFCSNFHEEPTCPLEAKIRQMEEEREQIREKFDDHLPIKTYSDSTLRHVNQKALASDVDAMSGGSTGNILNAIEIDPNNEAVENIIIVAGQNEINRTMEPEKFLWIMERNKERLMHLARKKNIAIIPPPPQNFVISDPKAKEEIFQETLAELSKVENITIWDNPITEYHADGGQHPTETQTKELINFIDARVQEYFQIPYKLPSATSDEITTERFYNRVNSLYKYGCSACNQKKHNKVSNLCDECLSKLRDDETILTSLETFRHRVKIIDETNNPKITRTMLEVSPVTSDNEGSTAECKCRDCGEVLQSGLQIREHYDTKHPGLTSDNSKQDIRAKGKHHIADILCNKKPN